MQRNEIKTKKTIGKIWFFEGIKKLINFYLDAPRKKGQGLK